VVVVLSLKMFLKLNFVLANKCKSSFFFFFPIGIIDICARPKMPTTAYRLCTEEFGGNKVDLAAMIVQQVVQSSKNSFCK